jgi:hypothetical protein
MSDRPYTPPLPPEVLLRLYMEAQRRGTKMTRLLKWIECDQNPWDPMRRGRRAKTVS